MKISVVTPTYRSGPYLDELHRRSVAAIAETGADAYEIIFVNDQCPADSLAVATAIAKRDPNVVVVDLARNFGQHKAIIAGLSMAMGDLVFVMDSDLEEEPEWISLFYREMQRKNADVVFGVNHNIKNGILYSMARRLFYKTLNFLSAAHFPENVCAARLMTRRYLDALLQFKEREIFLVGLWHMTGFTQLPIEVVKHDSSPSTYSFARLANIFVNGVTAFSTRPLILISLAGIALSLVAFIYTGLIIFQKLVHGVAVEGWASVMAVVLMLGGITLFFNGVMAIYLAKVFIEVKQRPLFIVKDIKRGGDTQSVCQTLHQDQVALGSTA